MIDNLYCNNFQKYFSFSRFLEQNFCQNSKCSKKLSKITVPIKNWKKLREHFALKVMPGNESDSSDVTRNILWQLEYGTEDRKSKD